MSVTQQQLNLNQFSLQAIVGQKAENFGLTMVKQCVVSPNQTTALVPGQAVQFDTAVTSGPIPSIIAASPSQKADGYIEYDVKNGGNLVSGVVCSVIISGALYLLADVAMDQGARNLKLPAESVANRFFRPKHHLAPFPAVPAIPTPDDDSISEFSKIVGGNIFMLRINDRLPYKGISHLIQGRLAN